jgi:hypothetical protein
MVKDLSKPQSINIPLDKTTPVVCSNCQNDVFQESIMLRKVSKFLIGSTEDSYQAIPIVSCSKCGTALQEMLPPQLRKADANS